jgi:hypothetical protein
VSGASLVGPRNPRWSGGANAARARKNSARRVTAENTDPHPCLVCASPVYQGNRKYCSLACRQSPQAGRFIACTDCGKLRKRIKCQPNARCQRCAFAKRRGAGNPNWKGGITPENDRIRHSPEYIAWRKAVFERDRYTCVSCGQVGGTLHADHIKPFCAHPRLRTTLSNGRTLCVRCHEKTPTYKRKASSFNQEAA